MARILCTYYFAIQILALVQAANEQCRAMKFDQDSTVCVCDAHYCDSSEVDLPPPGQYLSVTSNREGLRFKKKIDFLQESCNNGCNDCTMDLKRQKLTLKINRTMTYQEILGFGAAFSDASGINTASLTREVQEKLLRSYFTPSGLGYNMGRVPIGGTDFSTRGYTYDDVTDDPQLLSFSLQEEDYKYKIPYIQWAKELASEELHITTTVWTPPLFMKVEKSFVGKTHLNKEYYESYAQYYLRFLREYKKNGVEFWSITPGNEPSIGLFSYFYNGNTCGWLPDELAEWVINHFGPAIRNSEFNQTKILLLDDSRHTTVVYLQTMLLHTELEPYLDGIATHWYADGWVNSVRLDEVLDQRPELPLYTTEMCTGSGGEFGAWTPAETYARWIIGEMNHRTSAFIDWNFALDTEGGPTYTNNTVGSHIVVDKVNNRFFKQPSYYAFGHFSKYISRGSRRVEAVETTRSDLDTVAFLRPDGYIAAVLHNRHNHTVFATVEDEVKGVVNVELTPKSVTTLVY